MRNQLQAAVKWLLWTPTRLIAVAAGVFVVVYVIGLIAAPGVDVTVMDTPTPTGTPVPASVTPGPATPSVSTSPEHTGHDDEEATTTQRRAMTVVAASFVRAWARPDQPPRKWLAGLKPYADPAYLDALRTVNPSNIAATKVTGPVEIRSSHVMEGLLAVPTNAGPALVLVVYDGREYRVTRITPPEAEPTTTTPSPKAR